MNTYVLGMYRILKYLSPNNNSISESNVEIINSHRPFMVKDNVAMPILHSLSKIDFYTKHELKWIKKIIDSQVPPYPLNNGEPGGEMRDYIYNAPTLINFIDRIIDVSTLNNESILFKKTKRKDLEIRVEFNNDERNFNSGFGSLFLIAYSIQMFFGKQIRINTYYSNEELFDIETYKACIYGEINAACEAYITISDADLSLENPIHNKNKESQPGSTSKVFQLTRESTISKIATEKIKLEILEKNTYISANDIASHFNMNCATLYKKLGDEGTSYRELVGKVRKEIAKDLILDKTVTLKEISYRLGYANPTAFNRAFKTWFGTSASGYRDIVGNREKK